MAELKPMEVIMKIDFVALSGVEVVAHAEWVAELVRCGECIHLTDHDCPISWPKNAEDYCSFGERRADNG